MASYSSKTFLKVISWLKKTYPEATTALQFKNPFELLVATILSAQCTDVRVNLVTKTLFKKYKKPIDYLKVESSDLEQDIRSIGFFRNKAKNIRGMCAELLQKHEGVVPQTMEELILLPGVGRKTANVVLGNAFNKNIGVCVDTHVSRISERLGIINTRDPIKVEQALMKLAPQKDWTVLSHWMIYHGRAICDARKPLCDQCGIRQYCQAGKI